MYIEPKYTYLMLMLFNIVLTKKFKKNMYYYSPNTYFTGKILLSDRT